MQFMASSPDMAAKLAGLDKLRVMNAAAYEKEIPLYSQAVAACTHTTLTVPTHHQGDFDVPVLVHTPKEKTSWML